MEEQRLIAAIDRATALRVLPKSRHTAATLRDAGRIMAELIAEVQGRLPAEVTGATVVADTRVLTEVAHLLCSEEHVSTRREVGLFSAADLRDDAFLAENELLRLDAVSDETVWPDSALESWGLQRIPEVDDEAPPLHSAGLEDHLRACEHFRSRRAS